jgi:hypothetical protein
MLIQKVTICACIFGALFCLGRDWLRLLVADSIYTSLLPSCLFSCTQPLYNLHKASAYTIFA